MTNLTNISYGSNVGITRSVPEQRNVRSHLLHGDHLPRGLPRHQNWLPLLRLPPPLQVLKRAPWTFLLGDAVCNKRNVKIACEAANTSTAGEQTTWLDNVQTDKVTTKPMLLPFVHRAPPPEVPQDSRPESEHSEN